jgi:hypothetical protein
MWKTLPCCELLSRTKTINELFNHLRHGQRRFDKTTKRLNCFIDNVTTMGFDYLKICDSQANALALIKKEMRYHGGNPITLAAPQCDPDGSFYAKQCDGNQCYCRS